MRESIKHVNSKGEVLDFTELGILINYNDLRDYEWTVTSSNDRITKLSKGIVKKTIPFVFFVDENNASAIKNSFYEHFDVDVRTKCKGYFEINGYRFYCFLTKSVKSNYLVSERLLTLKVTLQTDDADWSKETLKSIDFSKTENHLEGMIYPFTYPYTYDGPKTVIIANNDFIPCDAIIRIYGVAENPAITIEGNVYAVNANIAAGEYIEISTFDRTVVKYDNLGKQINLFNERNKKYDIFAQIPIGSLEVVANGAFRVDIVLLEKRSEPKWA